MKIFKDRESAGKLLAARLKNTKADIVLGIPRGGVVVAAEVAKVLNLPLDIVVTRKIGAPGQKELALGAVDPDGEVVLEEDMTRDLRLKIKDLGQEIKDQWKELKRREDVYRAGRADIDIKDKTVILVDDGIATGATTLAAVRFLKRHGAKVILGVPVASKEAVDKLKDEADEVIVLSEPESFRAVGEFYQHFLPVSDEEVIQLLQDGS